MKSQIQDIVLSTLPESFYVILQKRKAIISNDPQLLIAFAPNNYEINQVKGQHPQLVSLLLNMKTLELNTQVFGGNGGGNIYREPDPNHPKEKYLAMVGVKVPFRKPKQTQESVLRAIQLFCERYIQTLKDNKETLRYKDVVDYSFLND
jgi:hypothetical protein